MPVSISVPEAPTLSGRRKGRRDGRMHLTAPHPVDRRVFRAVFTAAGRVKQADQEPAPWLLPPEVLEAAAGLYLGRPVYLDHADAYGFGWHQEPKVARLVGVITAAEWDPAELAVVGEITLYDEDPNSPGHFVRVLFDQILADQAAGRPVPPVGLSAVFYHETHLDAATGLTVTDRIRYVESVDLVYDPGAAGYIRAALSAQQPKGDQAMSEDTRPLATQAKGPAGRNPADLRPAEARSAELHPAEADDRELDYVLGAHDRRLDSLEIHLERLQQALSVVQERTAVRGMETPAVRHMRDSMDQVTLAVEALIAGTRPPDGVRPLSGIRELYTLLSGDYELTGTFQADRVTLANVTSATMAGLVANALNKRVINAFQSYPRWWEPAVTEEDFASLQDVRWVTLGGIGELPTVPEGAAYAELTWDDATETASFVKKGGYLGITIEAIDKDDTRRLQAAPRALAQAAWLTLGKTIAALFTANSGYGAVMSDGHYLFDSANHGNLGTSAFSHSAWVATKLAMMKQTELNSGERMGALTKGYLIWVPVDLEADALAELATGEGEVGSANYNVNVEAGSDSLTGRLGLARQRVITCPFWTDANDWVAQADPRLYPGIGLGYRYGRAPEIYSVASPTAGLMFSNDTMPIKVRFFFAVAPTDYRAFYKHMVS